MTSTCVECPVKGCSQSVERQHDHFRREERYYCPDHKIYISPSTFEYANEEDNLLWKSKPDLDLLKAIKTVKRESRIARDNSEDALTWNIFRFLEITNQLGGLLSWLTQMEHAQTELIYWSYSQKTKEAWSELNKARKEFGENLQRSSEPDLIAITNRALFFIEAKLTAPNDTLPSDPNNRKKYLTGGKEWYGQVFASDFYTVAIRTKKYELLRFWLLGSWIAEQIKRDFYLINVVPIERETDIEKQFTPHIRVTGNRQFKRLSWEELYGYVAANVPDGEDRRRLTVYFENKTIGYDPFGMLQKAFSIE